MDGKHAKGKRNELFSVAEDAVPLSSLPGRESRHQPHPQFSLNLVRENGNETGFLYGLLLSAPFYDPSYGIQLVFEGWHIEKWNQPEEGVFLVSIKGHNLGDIAAHIKASGQERLVVGENVTGFTVEKIPPKKS